jgi:hypothetical protein
VGSQAPALLAFASALLIAACTALFAYIRYAREQEHQRRTLLNALFAELANILEHYTYAAAEFPTDSADVFELKKRLRWSKYGVVRSANDIGKMGFLDASSIKALLQLELRIRNDAILLDQLLEDAPSATPPRLRSVKARLEARVADAGWLLNQLVAKRSALKQALADLTRDLPVITDV